MTDYQGNTHKEKEETSQTEEKKKRIERITSEEVIIQKQGPWRKFKNLIIEADMSSVGRFIWLDLLVPMVKNMIVDTVEQGIKRTVYGDRRAAYRPPSSMLANPVQRVTYNSPVSRPYSPEPRTTMPALPSGPKPSSQNGRGYIITTRDDAERVLEMMSNIIDHYGVVTVAELHEMLGLESNPIDTRWGWDDIRSAQIRQIREGWVLELPSAGEVTI